MTAVDELITWLRAALDEDERVARAAHIGPWRAEPATESVYARDSSVVHMPGPLPDWATYIVTPDSEGSEGIDPSDADHIARWDPARVLAEVEAKRRILDEAIRLMGYDGEFNFVEMLAQPYAGREGWREEWAA